MDKKVAMKRIIELTHSENWQEDKEIVAEVQKLGKPMWAEKTKRRTPRRIIEDLLQRSPSVSQG